MLFMAVYERILAIHNVNWVAMDFALINLHLGMPNSATRHMPEREPGC
jgi:hypothetical protein